MVERRYRRCLPGLTAVVVAMLGPSLDGVAEDLFTHEERAFWAFQPVDDPPVPQVAAADWCSSPIDRFLIARLEVEGLKPAPLADKRTQLRRVTFDLIGLPPTPEEIDSFLADDSDDAFAKVVDRLLASPHYGERWGRRWLDLARYADSNGSAADYAHPYSYQYRDYVIRAFNNDKPYDQFVVEQIAGDLLPQTEDPAQNADQLIATGLLVMGPKPIAQQDKQRMILDIVDEQIDMTGRTFLGLSIACARCHDHKFDPIPTRDYYSLAGIFYSTRTMADREVLISKWMERPVPGPNAETAMAMAVEDDSAADLRIHEGGDPKRLGADAPRGFLRILCNGQDTPLPADKSGRLELARWIASPKNPLSARVMINRIWQGHFGAGLVATADNFGAMGERPSHPELLDWLASRFIESGWSIKAMHRLMLLTSAYQMTSLHRDAVAEAADLENRLLWRRNARRLDAEEIRDAMLAASGRLDRTMGGSLFDYQPRYLDETKDRGLYALELSGKTYHPFYTTRRSVYLPSPRVAPHEVLQLFDGANSNVTVARRAPTTVAPQTLFMMNSAVVREYADHFARRLLGAATDDSGRLEIAHRLALGRAPTQEEIDGGLDFINHYAAAWSAARIEQAEDGPHTSKRLRITLKRSHHNFRLDEMPDNIREKFEREPGMRLRLSVSSKESGEQGPRSTADWQVLMSDEAASEHGTTLTVDSDGQSVRVPEKSKMPDTYVILTSGPPTDAKALRLDVLPESGVEYYSVDHFVLGEVRIEAELPAQPGEFRPVPLRSAVAAEQHITDSLPKCNVSATPLIDGDDDTNWPIAPVDGEVQTVVFEADEASIAAWRSYCQSLFMLNEFVYVD